MPPPRSGHRRDPARSRAQSFYERSRDGERSGAVSRSPPSDRLAELMAWLFESDIATASCSARTVSRCASIRRDRVSPPLRLGGEAACAAALVVLTDHLSRPTLRTVMPPLGNSFPRNPRSAPATEGPWTTACPSCRPPSSPHSESDRHAFGNPVYG